jgi:hypothetical protein
MRFFSAVFPGKNPAPALATQATRTRRWPLDLPLIKFSRHPNDIWRLSDAFQDVLIIGAKGSGKTSGSGKVFASKYLQAGFGGLQRESYLFGLLTLAEHHEAKHPEWPMIQNYWTRDWAKLNPITRGIIESDFTGSSSLWAPSFFPSSATTRTDVSLFRLLGGALGGVASVPVPVHANCFDELPRLFGTALKASARPLTPKRRSHKSDAKEVLI